MKYILPPKKNMSPAVSKNLNYMIVMLEKESELWKDKKGKTIDTINKCKNSLEMAKSFVDDDEWKPFTVVMQRNINVEILKKCFYHNKNKQNEMLNLYVKTNKKIIKWMRLLNSDD